MLTLAYDPLGRMTTMVDQGRTTIYAYDARGQMTGKTDVGGYVQAYAYDQNGSRTLLVDPDGGRWTYRYDALSRQSDRHRYRHLRCRGKEVDEYEEWPSAHLFERRDQPASRRGR